MKNNNKIYSFFIVLALLFWNPLSFYFFYGDNNVFQITELHILFWLVFVIGLLNLYLLTRNKVNGSIKNLIFTLSITGILAAFLVIINSLTGLYFKRLTGVNPDLDRIKKNGIIFEPNTKARYQTVEYNHLSSINSIGLRDREITIDKGEKYRILCVGDSWTFGWGVNIDNSWPKQLEQYFLKLNLPDIDIEVINAGGPGLHTKGYRHILANAVPLLKPDLVLVGILQLDDLAQLGNYLQQEIERKSQPKKKETPKIEQKEKINILNAFVKASIGNILSLIPKEIQIKPVWELAAKEKINNFNELQKLRFSNLADTVQQLFKTANLNPSLMIHYLDSPDDNMIYNTPNHPTTKIAINEMIKDVEILKAICMQNNAQLVFVNMPMNYFTNHRVIRTSNDTLTAYLTNHNKIDSIYSAIARLNTLSYIELTSHFNGLMDKEKFFFLFDGHPNENGYSEIAKYIGNQLVEQQLLY